MSQNAFSSLKKSIPFHLHLLAGILWSERILFMLFFNNIVYSAFLFLIIMLQDIAISPTVPGLASEKLLRQHLLAGLH